MPVCCPAAGEEGAEQSCATAQALHSNRPDEYVSLYCLSVAFFKHVLGCCCWATRRYWQSTPVEKQPSGPNVRATQRAALPGICDTMCMLRRVHYSATLGANPFWRMHDCVYFYQRAVRSVPHLCGCMTECIVINVQRAARERRRVNDHAHAL